MPVPCTHLYEKVFFFQKISYVSQTKCKFCAQLETSNGALFRGLKKNESGTGIGNGRANIYQILSIICFTVTWFGYINLKWKKRDTEKMSVGIDFYFASLLRALIGTHKKVEFRVFPWCLSIMSVSDASIKLWTTWHFSRPMPPPFPLSPSFLIWPSIGIFFFHISILYSLGENKVICFASPRKYDGTSVRAEIG